MRKFFAVVGVIATAGLVYLYAVFTSIIALIAGILVGVLTLRILYRLARKTTTSWYPYHEAYKAREESERLGLSNPVAEYAVDNGGSAFVKGKVYTDYDSAVAEKNLKNKEVMSRFMAYGIYIRYVEG